MWYEDPVMFLGVVVLGWLSICVVAWMIRKGAK